MYISNYCVNKCKYCGYNLENNINRRKLNQEEIKAEAKAIAQEGCRHLILVTKMSAGVSTAVGGHTLKNAGTAQFDINDESSVEEIINMIKSVGYQPILKDWERI